jgi:hypothetical protein
VPQNSWSVCNNICGGNKRQAKRHSEPRRRKDRFDPTGNPAHAAILLAVQQKTDRSES